MIAMNVSNRPDENRPALRESAAGVGHEEWLMDQAILGSFPASDPASSTQPGSIVNERYTETARDR